MIESLRWWDIDDVMVIERDVFGPTAWTPAQFWSELAQPDRTYLVARDGADLVGYAGLMSRRPTADIQTIAVAPSHRRRGLARELLRRLLDVAAGCDCTEVLLEVRADGAPAIALYESEGFEVISRRQSYYGPGEDALIMRRRQP
jgi:ribosomal-protein-alanine N-acetyltransferase